MGDWFQIVADVDATPEEAPRLAEATVAWMVTGQIIQSDLTDCVLGAGLGHAPGPRYTSAAEPDSTGLDLVTNGMAVTT